MVNKHAPSGLDLGFVLGRDIMLLRELGSTCFGGLFAFSDGREPLLWGLYVRTRVSD